MRAEDLIELSIGPVAHGGHCVARHEGRVVFVRHTLPGERVLARVIDAPETGSFWRAEAVEVLEASADRVDPAWPAAGPGGVGGGELSHVALPAQRRWKADVLEEQLRRLARLDREVVVHAAPGDDERGGLGWRTRIELVADAHGNAGMHRHRSHDVVRLTGMPLATPEVEALGLFDRRWPAGARITAAAPASGDRPVVLVGGEPWGSNGPDKRPNARVAVREVVTVAGAEYQFKVAAAGFWQVHRSAPQVLAEAVLAAAGPVAGATVVDLYSGSGLFTTPLADAVGEAGQVHAVEGDARAVRDALRALHGRDHVTVYEGDVKAVLRSAGAQEGLDLPGRADVVVLDPPRTGAGRAVVEQIAALQPARVVYVACDPAALARDVAYLAGHGYELDTVDGYDLFPHTHHVEAVAVLTRS